MTKPSEALECLEEMKNYNPCQCPECYTLGEWCREELAVIKQALQRLEAIDNANPSEALECLNNIEADLIGLPKHITECDEGFDNYLEDIEDNIDKVEQALLKAQEPKQYLKWEDLEFNHKAVFTEAKLGETIYDLVIGFDCTGKETIFLRTDNQQIVFHEKDKQFFNDLHLERVE